MTQATEPWTEGDTMIGSLTVGDGAPEYTQHYECAAWHLSDVPLPGTYPVVERRSRFNGYARTAVVVAIPSRITSACFVSRLGAQYGRDDGPQRVGTVHERTYMVARQDDMALFDRRPQTWREGSYGAFHDSRDDAVRAWSLGTDKIALDAQASPA